MDTTLFAKRLVSDVTHLPTIFLSASDVSLIPATKMNPTQCAVLGDGRLQDLPY